MRPSRRADSSDVARHRDHLARNDPRPIGSVLSSCSADAVARRRRISNTTSVMIGVSWRGSHTCSTPGWRTQVDRIWAGERANECTASSTNHRTGTRVPGQGANSSAGSRTEQPARERAITLGRSATHKCQAQCQNCYQRTSRLWFSKHDDIPFALAVTRGTLPMFLWNPVDLDISGLPSRKGKFRIFANSRFCVAVYRR